MTSLARALLAVDGIGHAFGGFRVLSNVGFDVPRGNLVGLMGPNGSGKTTLFNIICGFLHPQSGAVLLDGRPLGTRSVVQRSRLGLVRTFQTPKVFEHLSVLENVMVGLYKESHGGILASMVRLPMARREVSRMRDLAAATCEAFGLGGIKQQRAGALTAGARRNVELARAVVSEPHLLLLDEPSSGLSKEEVDQLREHLVRINRAGLTILLVSHDMDLMSVVSRVHVLSAGEIIASGTFDEMQRNTQVQQVYLGL